jgi:hypothetical protein
MRASEVWKGWCGQVGGLTVTGHSGKWRCHHQGMGHPPSRFCLGFGMCCKDPGSGMPGSWHNAVPQCLGPGSPISCPLQGLTLLPELSAPERFSTQRGFQGPGEIPSALHLKVFIVLFYTRGTGASLSPIIFLFRQGPLQGWMCFCKEPGQGNVQNESWGKEGLLRPHSGWW